MKLQRPLGFLVPGPAAPAPSIFSCRSPPGSALFFECGLLFFIVILRTNPHRAHHGYMNMIRSNVATLAKAICVVLLCLSHLSICHGQQRQRQRIDLGDLGDLGSLLGGLAGAAGGGGGGGGGGGAGIGQAGQECPQHCSSSNLHPVPKKHIRPYSNGCSVPPFLREGLGDYRHFTPCCDLHDTCYMACGATKTMCDQEFGKCMKKICGRKFKNSKTGLDKCTGMAQTFELGVSMFGCQGYSELQAEGCDCVPRRDAHGRVKAYAEAFYETYNTTHPLPDSIRERYLDGKHRKPEEHGELIFRLYRKYTDSIEIISRDGMSGRDGPTYFRRDIAYGSEL